MNASKIRIRMLVPILLCFFALGPMALAQVTNASLTGVITDKNGAAIPGVRIHVTNTGTNAVETTETNSSGVYLVAPLNPGSYQITAEKAGFRKLVQTGITLTVDQAATLNLTLQIGEVAQAITVVADAEVIDTTTAEIGTTVNEEAVKELPLNGRNPASLVLLATGTTNVLNTAGGKVQGETTIPDETGASIGGGRQGSTFYMLDGAPNMDTYMALAAPFPNPDATQEFRVITNNYDAHYGFAPGAIVTIQTKSGANQFHGGAFWFNRNSMYNAADYFGHNVDPLHRNTVGGDVGGPVLKNKFFFFGNYQYERNSSQATNGFANFPTAAMLGGDFTEIAALTGKPVNGPDNLFVDSKIDPSLFSPGAVKLAKVGLPVGTDNPSNPGWTQYPGAPTLYTYTQGTTRLDYNLNDKQKLFQRSFIEYYDNKGSAVKGNIIAVSPGNKGEFYNEVLGHTWTINDTTVNTANVYWTQMDVLQEQASLDTSGKPICMSEYVNVSEKPGHCFIEGFVIQNAFWSNWAEPTGERRTTYGLSDAFTKTVKNNTISAGADIVHQFAQENTDYPTTPVFEFWGNWTGYGIADYLTGNVGNFMQGGGEISSLKGWMLGLYGQDAYRVKPNLTVTLGLRWDPNTPPVNTGGRGSQWRPGVQSTMFPNAPTGEIFPGDAGLDAALMPTTYNYWEPRIGVAYQPKALPHTAFRAGFGVFTGPLQYSTYNHTSDIAPFSPTFNISNVVSGTQSQDVQVPFDNPWNAFYTFQPGKPLFFPAGNQFTPPHSFASLSYVPPKNSPFVTPVNLQAEFSPNFKLGITQSWNFSIEQQLSPTMALHVAYVGSESYHGSVIIDANASGVMSLSGKAWVRPYSNFQGILVQSSVGNSPYHSLQIGFEKRNSHGLSLQSNFTWSKVEDLASSGNVSFVGNLADPFNLKENKGISDLNVPYASITNFVYTSPALKSWNPIVRGILGTWEVSTIYTMQSHSPFSISGGYGGNSGSQQGGDRADVVPGQVPWSHRGSRSQWRTEYWNTAAFTDNAVNTFGNSGRNLFRGPYLNYDDSQIAKNISYHERYKLQLRFELFNTFNHVSWGNPDNNPDSGTKGQINGEGPVAPRVCQASAKFYF